MKKRKRRIIHPPPYEPMKEDTALDYYNIGIEASLRIKKEIVFIFNFLFGLIIGFFK